MCMCVEFRDEILLRGAECKTPENSNFYEKGKIIISVKNPEFFYILDDKTNFIVGIASRNLATTSNFVEFRDSKNFMFFEAPRVVRDAWHVMSGSQCATCQAWDKSNNELMCGT